MAGQDASVPNHRIFIGNHAIERNVFADNRILHQNRVFDLTSARDMHATENDGIFGAALDDAAVGDQAVANLCAVQILCRRGTAHLCVDRVIRNLKKLAAHFRAQNIHIAGKIGGKRVDRRSVSVKVIDIIIGMQEVFADNVVKKAFVAMRDRIADQC